MPLRRSPTRTPALLAANRANAQKSTGPRTPEGKSRAGLNSFRYALRAPKFIAALAKSSRAWEEFRGLHLALYAALLPDKTDETAVDVFERTVLHVWAMKQELTRWAASRAEREAWFAQTGGVCPAPLQLLIKRPGWRVRVSVWLRWGRGRGRRRWLQAAGNWKERQARLHVVVTVTASIGHPLLGCTSLGDGPQGLAPRVVFRTKPECIRKHKSSLNMIEPSRIGMPLGQGAAPAAPTPHAGSAHAGLPRPDGVSGKPGATTRPVQTLAELLALAPGQDPVGGAGARARADLISWLRPENVVLSGPPLSESEDIERWVHAVVTRWEKHLGLVPKKETKPECSIKRKGYGNMITIKDLDRPFAKVRPPGSI